MGLGLSFQLNKVSRFIKSYGNEFEFERYGKNKYGEKDPEKFEKIRINGVYHEVNSQVTFATSEGTRTKSSPQPRILCNFEEGSKIKTDDEISYKGTRYKVVDPSDLLKAGICIDISLEVIQDG